MGGFQRKNQLARVSNKKFTFETASHIITALAITLLIVTFPIFINPALSIRNEILVRRNEAARLLIAKNLSSRDVGISYVLDPSVSSDESTYLRAPLTPSELEQLRAGASGVRTYKAIAFFTLVMLFALRLAMKLFTTTRHLGKAPGVNFLLIVDFLYSPKTVEKVFKPIVADWRTEYFDALSQGRLMKARWISVRYIYSFIIAMGLSKVFDFVNIFTSVRR